MLPAPRSPVAPAVSPVAESVLGPRYSLSQATSISSAPFCCFCAISQWPRSFQVRPPPGSRWQCRQSLAPNVRAETRNSGLACALAQAARKASEARNNCMGKPDEVNEVYRSPHGVHCGSETLKTSCIACATTASAAFRAGPREMRRLRAEDPAPERIGSVGETCQEEKRRAPRLVRFRR